MARTSITRQKKMEAHDARITQIERRQDRLDDSLERLADDIHRIALAVAQQAEDRTTLKRAFDQIEAMRADIEAVKSLFQATEERRLREVIQSQKSEIDDDRKHRVALAWELGRMGIVALGAAVLAHFGVRIFG